MFELSEFLLDNVNKDFKGALIPSVYVTAKEH